MRLLGLLVFLSFIITACGGAEAVEVFADTEPVCPASWNVPESVFPPIANALQIEYVKPEPVFPNEVGKIMILVYHGLHEETPGPYDRLTADFRNDLQMLYDQGYRLISMADLVNNNITTPRGYTPVVLSFDDGLPSAFSMIELEDGTLAPKPGTAVYIINEFYEKNPDFGRTAIFFINGRPEPFRGAGTLEERFRYLLDYGFELGNHSYSHANFVRLNAQSLQRDIGRLDQLLRRYAPDFEPLVFAYPFSIRPRRSLMHYILEGEYDGKPYSYAWALRVGNTGSPAVPHHINFDPVNVSRVVASDISTYYYVVPDLGHLLRRFKENPELRFISDGDPNTVTVPRHLKHYVNIYNLGDRELVVYGIYDNCEDEEERKCEYEQEYDYGQEHVEDLEQAG